MGTRKRRTLDGRDYLADVLHDIRQPLTALRLDLAGALQLLSRDPPAVPETREALRDAIADTDDLQRLLDRMQGRTTSSTATTPRATPPDPPRP